jgi:hypothetical protein
MPLSDGPSAQVPDRSPAAADWSRGVTAARLALLLAVSVMLAARPAMWDFDPARVEGALRRLLYHTGLNLAFGLPLFLLVVKVELATARASVRARLASLAAAIVAGAVIYSMGIWFMRSLAGDSTNWHWSLAFFVRAVVLGTLFTAILWYARREREVQRRLHRLNLAKVDIERRMTEARLRLLRAQIEPHLLFNSLAIVQRLYQGAPDRGRALLGNLRRYLRGATARARERETRLDGEIELARSFLGIFGERMGKRLRVRIDLAPEVASARIPPLILGTLVENAIKHGIGPRSSGGTICIDARRAGEMVEVRVCDDGVGFRSRSGQGVGLSNARARLEALYGSSASLELVAKREGGVCAILQVPHWKGAQP